MPELPSGTVTFLFTDIEGSTRLLSDLGDAYAAALAEHRRVLRDAFERYDGVEVDTQGDAFFVAFRRASDALAAAAEARNALDEGPVRARMGLHTGEPLVTSEGYVGLDVHRAARIAAVGHGGQILVSQATRDLSGVEGLRDLGEHRLKDLAAPERLYQFGNAEFPPLRSLNNSNLPLPAEPMLGRKKELADVLRALHEGARLVTITGPGGIGKTRFALEVAAELIDDFADGVWWVGLAPLRNPKLVIPTIAAVVGAKDKLDTELRGKRLLLLLDNLEQVVDAAPDLAELQRACPNVVLVNTSREPLHIAGEREYPLSPLGEAPAVELLRQRADAATPGFDASYHELVELCDRLDRLPLAIELAAARTKSLSVAGLLERLNQRLPILTSRRRDVDERQRTLRATIEWSYDLLAKDEKRFFAHLSVFAGSFAMIAAESVAGGDLDALEALVDKSILRRTDDERFFMLETIREYAGERLDASGSGDDVRRRHAEWIRDLALEARDELRRERQGEFLDALAREHENIRAALQFAIGSSDERLAVTILGSLGRYWVFRAHEREARSWFDAALALPHTTRDERLWRALYWHAVIVDGLGDDLAATEATEAALALARELDDPEALSASSLELVRRLLNAGNIAPAEALLEEADDNSDRHAGALFAYVRGQILLHRGDATAAAAEFRKTVVRDEELGDIQGASMALAYLALAEAACGHSVESRRLLSESLGICTGLGFAWGIAICLQGTAALALLEADAATAAAMLVRADALFEAIGTSPTGVEAELYQRSWSEARIRLDEVALSRIRAETPTGDVEETLAYIREYLD